MNLSFSTLSLSILSLCGVTQSPDVKARKNLTSRSATAVFIENKGQIRDRFFNPCTMGEISSMGLLSVNLSGEIYILQLIRQ